MREIKFRGKRIDNGEWTVGDLAKYDGVSYIIRENAKAVDGEQAFWFFEVSRESVGQYTGLKDKNGVEIYEGDILDKQSYWGWYVKFEEGAFRQVPLRLVQRLNWEHHVATQYNSKYWEVIGNIHDTPGLIEGEE